MNRILITGATGNIGVEVIRHLYKTGTSNLITAGVRNIEKAGDYFKNYPALEFVHCDFENEDTFDQALAGVDRIFLLRPPHLAEVDKYFRPFIARAKEKNIREIIFLSVQGAEKSRVIPHNKIERLIHQFDLDYIFVRPGYFMQNLTTTLLNDIQKKREIILPAGKAKFNWIDIKDIGHATAVLLDKFETHKNQAFEITGTKNATFGEVTSLINRVTKKPIRYRNINPLRYFWMKKQEGMASGKIIVMIFLHFIPRFQKEPEISHAYEQLTGKKPTDLKEFIEREKSIFER